MVKSINLLSKDLHSVGIIRSKSASPAAIANALDEMCFISFIKEFFASDKVILIIDPTTQDDRIVKLTAAIWYCGRALPLAWLIWPANKPLKGDGFWKRVDSLLGMVAQIIPKNVSVICIADRAFGSPSFIDLVTKNNGLHCL